MIVSSLDEVGQKRRNGSLWVLSHSHVQTDNMFNGESGLKVCALDRAAIVAGRTARQVCFQLPSSEPILLPADVDVTRFPGAAEDAPLLGLSTNALKTFALHVDWSNPSKSRLSSATTVPVAAYNPACGVLYQVAARVSAPFAPPPVPGVAGQVPLLGPAVLSARQVFPLALPAFADGPPWMCVTHAGAAAPTTPSHLPV